MKNCVICGKFLTKRQHKCCSPRCAGRIRGRLVFGTGIAAPYLTIRVGGRKMLYHRRIWEKAHGKKLQAGEIVHHKNGNKRDNRPQNLEVVACQAEHLRLHNYHRKFRGDNQRHFSDIGW